MAGNVENVLNMIETLRSKFYNKGADEVAELQEYAVYEGFQSSLELWDVPYWARRHREHLYKLVYNMILIYNSNSYRLARPDLIFPVNNT